MRNRTAPCVAVLLSAVAATAVASHAWTPAQAQSGSTTPPSQDPHQAQLTIATAKFQEALAAAREAHRLMPTAVQKSVIFEETNANRNKVSACESALADAKTDSNRARRAFNEARGKAKTSFEAAKRAVQELRRLGPDATGSSPLDRLAFVADLEAIEQCLKMLEQKLWKRINSSLTKRNRGYLWRDTQLYADTIPTSWASAEADSLVPESVLVPCLNMRIPMHVMPEK